MKTTDYLNRKLLKPRLSELKSIFLNNLHRISSLLKFQCLKKPNQICSNDIEIDDKTDFIIDANDQLIERLVRIETASFKYE